MVEYPYTTQVSLHIIMHVTTHSTPLCDSKPNTDSQRERRKAYFPNAAGQSMADWAFHLPHTRYHQKRNIIIIMTYHVHMLDIIIIIMHNRKPLCKKYHLSDSEEGMVCYNIIL